MIADWKKFINHFSCQCDWLGIREYREVTDTLSARNGKSESTNSDISHGVMIEVLTNGQFAYAGTVDLSEQGLERAFKKALKMSQSSSSHKLFSFDPSVRPANQGSYQTPISQALDSLSFGEIQKKMIDLSSHLKISDEIIDSWAYARLIQTQVHFSSSNDSTWDQEFSIITKDFGVTAKRGNETQSRSYGLNGLQKGLEDLDDQILQEEALRVSQQAIELLGAKDCPNDTRDLLLNPDQLYLQIHESIGHPLELDRILGDERNYAGWSFISPEDFGALQYGSKLMNICFDPATPTGMASYLFDDNGVKAEKEYLIKEGLLLRGIGGIESQKRSGIPGVACGRSSDWNRPPMDRMANINLEPGSSSMQDMIAATEKGIIMQSNRSWSIDDYRNKFQFGCEYAQLIEDGEITETVKNPNYRGVTTPFWNNLKMVGNKDTFEVYGSPYCGKGEPNQIIRVGHSTPSCLFSNIEVFGGA
jgi:predicted Zn-dependent protease